AWSVEAQEGGAIAGRITDTAGRPVHSVSVSVDEDGPLTFTTTSGQYLFTSLSPGVHLIRTERIGYRVAERSIAIVAGETIRLDFSLAERAISLDEIVVTGTAIPSERKAVANSVPTIQTDKLVDAPIASFSQLLQGRVGGVAVLPSTGMTGEGAKILIRGSASLSLSNEPIVYVDGVRIDGTATLPFLSSGKPSRLDDIPPEAIERIEILKGAAAATLYGSEASNGVIQIFTKRGALNSSDWSVEASEGAIRAPTDRMVPVADFPASLCFGDPTCVQANTQRIRDYWGEDLAPYEVFQRDILPQFLETGRYRRIGASASGGDRAFTYRLSGRYSKEDGPLGLEHLGPASDANRRIQGTGSFTLFPTDDLEIDLTLLVGLADHTTMPNGNDLFGTYNGGFVSQLRLASDDNLFGETFFATTRETMQIEVEQSAENFTGAVGLRAQLHPRVDASATLGVNVVNEVSTTMRPFGWQVDGVARAPDVRGVRDRNFREVTSEAKASWRLVSADRIHNNLTVGAQGYVRTEQTGGGGGAVFPGPGLEVVGAAANQFLEERFERAGGLGVFGQDQLGYRDALFVTLGARLDASSTFGNGFDAAFYPKAGVSLLPLEFFELDGGPVSTLRVRAAVGRAGLQPASYASLTTLLPVRTEGGAGFVPGNLGNPDLKPEVSTEWEFGGDVGFLDDRISLDVTYWNRVVRDALLPGQFPVSGGFRAPQLTNIGLLEGSGLDVAVQGSVLDRTDLSLSVFANAAYLKETVADLGDSPELTVGGSYTRYRNSIRQGYAPGAFFGAQLADVAIPLDLDRLCVEPTREEALSYFAGPRFPAEIEVLPVDCGGDILGQFLGKPIPDWQGSFGGELAFLGQFQLSTLFEFKAGNFQVQDLSGAFRRSVPGLGLNTPRAAQVHATLMNPASTAEQRLDAAIVWARELRSLFPMAGLNQVFDADFVRWREVSLTYRLPAGLLDRVGLTSAAVSLGGQNLVLWGAGSYPGTDPESNVISRCEEGGVRCNFNLSTEMWGLPIPRRFTISARVGF
ncbi:MAG: TonB-dependent receptor domain-containing protein, partial [Longimicrobiales bacterium]